MQSPFTMLHGFHVIIQVRVTDIDTNRKGNNVSGWPSGVIDTNRNTVSGWRVIDTNRNGNRVSGWPFWVIDTNRKGNNVFSLTCVLIEDFVKFWSRLLGFSSLSAWDHGEKHVARILAVDGIRFSVTTTFRLLDRKPADTQRNALQQVHCTKDLFYLKAKMVL